MVGIFLVGFVWLNLQFSVSWLVDFQLGQCGSIFSFLCHGWQTFSGVRVAQSLVLCHGRQIFSGVRVTQSLVFSVMVGRLLVGFVWLNLQFSVSWLVDFQWGSCGSIFSFLCHGWQTFSGVRAAQSLVLCHGWYIFSGVRVAQSLVFCVMIGIYLVGFVWLNLQFSVSWLVGFQWGSCGSFFSFLCHGLQTFSRVRVAQSLVFCVMVGRLLVGFVWLNLQFSVSLLVDIQWGSCGSIFSFLCHGWQTFSGVRVAQSLVFCVIVGRSLVEFVWLNLQFSVSWLVDFQWGSCGSIFSFLCHGWQTLSGVRVAQSQWKSWQVNFQWGSCGHGWQIFSGVRVAQSLVFCVMVGRFLVGFVWLNLQFSVSWLVDFQWGSCSFSILCHGWQTFNLLVFCVISLVEVDFQWGSCGSIFSFLCHGWQTFSGVRVAQSLVFCVMVGRLLVGFVWLNLQFSVSCCRLLWFSGHDWQTFSGVRVAQSLVFCVMVGRLLVGFVSIFSFLCHGWQTFSGIRVQFCVMIGRLQRGSCGSIFSFLCWQTFSGIRVAQLLVGFVWLNLQFSVSWLVDFQWGSCGSIFSFLCHGWQTFSGVRVAQSLVFCVMVGRLLVGFVWLNLQFSVSWYGWQTFSGVRVAQSLVFCVMVGRFLVGFVWLNLQFSVSWLVDFQWGSCGSIFSFFHGWYIFSGVRVGECGSIFSFLCMVGRLLVGFVWLNLQFSVSWLVDFQWGSCGSIFSFLCHGLQTFSGVRVAQSLVFCVMVGRLLVGFVWLNLQFSVSWLVDFQWGSCGSISFQYIFSGVRVAQSLWS